MIVMNVDVSGINEIVKTFDKMPYKLEKVRDRAMDRTKNSVITAADKAIREEYTMKLIELKGSKKNNKNGMLRVNTKANKNGLSIVFTGRPITPVHFQHTPRTIPKLTPKGKRRKYIPTVTILKGSNKKLMPRRGAGKKMYPVFLAPTGTKSSEKIPNIFFALTGRPNKQGEKNREMKPIKTVSVPQMMTNKHVMPQIQKAAAEAFMKRFEHEAKRILEGKG